jgi:hypothetical protein
MNEEYNNDTTSDGGTGESNSKAAVDQALKEIGEVIYICLKYEACPIERLDNSLALIDKIIKDPDHLRECEYYFKASGSNYILFFFSNIIYNLKTRNDLILNQDVLKWLASVWNSFIQRNKKYQLYFPLNKQYSKLLEKFYGAETTFISKINNVTMVNEHFINGGLGDDSEIEKLERFFQVTEEILFVMKPSCFFLQDFFKEMKIATGEVPAEAAEIEKRGLAGFGADIYTYRKLVGDICRTLGLLEAIYLLLKKKKSARQFRIFDGKKKFLTTGEIYGIYAKKFDSWKKELHDLK